MLFSLGSMCKASHLQLETNTWRWSDADNTGGMHAYYRSCHVCPFLVLTWVFLFQVQTTFSARVYNVYTWQDCEWCVCVSSKLFVHVSFLCRLLSKIRRAIVPNNCLFFSMTHQGLYHVNTHRLDFMPSYLMCNVFRSSHLFPLDRSRLKSWLISRWQNYHFVPELLFNLRDSKSLWLSICTALA